MARHVILGAGGIGSSTARLLAAAGEDVVLVSRSGRHPDIEGVTALALDVSDPGALLSVCRGASTIVNALNPPSYTSWQRDWPPLAASVLAAAERSGARLVTIGNLYGYGQVDAPMTEATPVAPNGVKGAVRAQMWADALAAHDAGRVRATEVRASDYIGPATLSSSLVSTYLITPLLTGKSPRMPVGRNGVRHSWTFDQDVAALVVELARGGDDTAYGRVWHVPTDAAATFGDVAALVAEIAGVEARPVRVMPRAVVTIGGLIVPLLRELKETRHQFERPWELYGTAAQEHFGVRPTPLRDAVAATIDALRPGRRATGERETVLG